MAGKDPQPDRIIAHLDADAFFASVEQASDRHLRGKPMAVGGETRGVVASASYEARKFGIHSGMPTRQAKRLCPKLIVVPGDYEKYERFSEWMFSYLYDWTPDVEITSIDEGYFDLSGIRKAPLDVMTRLSQAIRETLKITVSEGAGSNKLVSQIASKLKKPQAIEWVQPGSEVEFLHPLPISKLPGIGPKTSSMLQSAGLARIEQIAQMSESRLRSLLGSFAPRIREFSMGIDPRPVISENSSPAKSYGHQETFDQDQTDERWIEAFLLKSADQLMQKVRRDGKWIRTITVLVRYNDMSEESRSGSLPEPTDQETDTYQEIRRLLKTAWSRRVSLRLVRLTFSNVYHNSWTHDLPWGPEATAAGLQGAREKRGRLLKQIDALKEKFGETVVLRGHDFILKDKPLEEWRVGPVGPVEPVEPVGLTACHFGCRSVFSFLNSTLSIEDIIQRASAEATGYVALVDQYHMGGALAFYRQALRSGLRPIVGAEVCVEGSAAPVTLIARSQSGYAHLCQVLSAQPELGEPVSRETLLKHAHRDWWILSRDPDWFSVFPEQFFLAVHSNTDPLLRRVSPETPKVAFQQIHYDRPGDQWKYHLVQAIRTQTRLKQSAAGKDLKGQFHWPNSHEIHERFQNCPEALANTWKLAESSFFEWRFGDLEFPEYNPQDHPPHLSDRDFLRYLTFEGVKRRYPERAKRNDVTPQLEEELEMIHEVGYESYFIAVWEILRLCKREGIDWITRGSAADSLVCYCLGISDICPIDFGLYFRRFLNKERMQLNKLPDIDVDFPHDRKDDVLRLIFEKYGPRHAALVGGFSTFQARGAVADVGKALGISEFQIRRITEKFPWGNVQGLKNRLKLSPETVDLPIQEEPYRSAIEMALFLDGLPRYPKAHPCGVVISRRPMKEITPTFMTGIGFPATHYDMDDVEALGLVKLDILAQGGLTALRETRAELQRQGISVPPDPTEMQPWTDPNVWKMISEGRSRGVHHIESPAMITLARMCRIREIHGLVALVSVIRPGAANQGKKQAFARRYQGMEPVTYDHPSLESCLSDAYGMVIYEEHILKICERFAGMNPGQADLLRRALGKAKSSQIIELKKQFVAAARRLERPESVIQKVWEQVEGFAGYAFCKAHSAAYAVEAYGAAWLKFYHPAEFMAAVLSGGKGFYSALVYILESHLLGLKFLPPSVQRPFRNFRVEHSKFLRTPLRWIRGISEEFLERMNRFEREEPFKNLRDFFDKSQPSESDLDLLLRSGALDCFSDSRVELFWSCLEWSKARRGSLSDVGNERTPLLIHFPETENVGKPEGVTLEEPAVQKKLEWENELLGNVMSAHPLDLHEGVAWETYCPIRDLHKYVGQKVTLCGRIVESRVFHQITGEMMKFLTLADYTGMVEIELFAGAYKRYGLLTARYPVLQIEGAVNGFENGMGVTLNANKISPPRYSGKKPRDGNCSR